MSEPTARPDSEITSGSPPIAPHEDECCDDDVPYLGEIDLVFDEVPYTYCGDHAVEHERDTADNRCGDSRDACCELG